MWMMVKEGGWGALLALGVGSLGVGLGIVALVLLVFSRKAAHAVGLATLALAFLAPMLGVLGMGSGRHKTDAVLGMVEGRGTQARLRYEGYRESQSAARVGAYFAILPLLLGATAALLGARKKPEDGSGNGRWIAAGVAGGVSLLMTGGAFAASMGPLPPRMDAETAELLDARDKIDTQLGQGCSDLARIIQMSYWHVQDRTTWPRRFEPDPRLTIPDFDAVATKCARNEFDNAKTMRSKLRDVLAYPLLVDEGLREEIQDEIAKPTPPFSDAIGDSFLHPPATFGGDGGAGKHASLRQGATWVNGRLPPEVIQRIARMNFGRFRACYEDGLKKNPALEGTVTVRFVIDRSGSVSSTSDGGSDLPDKDVVQCIVKAFNSLSFPQPEGGIVTVTYPLKLTTGT